MTKTTKTYAVPNKEMLEILARLEQEDKGLPDPTTLPPLQARDVADKVNNRWNQNLPAMGQIDKVVFKSPAGHDIPTCLFTPENRVKGLVMFIHGGGFSLCSIKTHERSARLLAEEASCAVLSVDYRLAPEHPFPAGLNDCISVFRQISHVYELYDWTCGPLAIAGDSSGANLALTLMLHEQAENRRSPDFAMLFYGVYGSDFATQSYRDYADGPGLTRDRMMRYFDWYAPKSARDNPLITPLNASDEALNNLPPLYLNAAEIDPLCSDTETIAMRLRSLNRKDDVRIYRGVVHGFMQMTLYLSAAREATTEAAYAFRKSTGS